VPATLKGDGCKCGVVVVQARREVSELVSSMVEAGGGLPLPEDRLLTVMEAAQVIHLKSIT